MIYIYRRRASTGARELADALTINARRLNDLSRAHYGAGVRTGDTVICWGETLDPIPGVTILNGGPIHNKFQDAITLRQAGVPTVEVSRERPRPTTPPTPPDPLPEQSRVTREALSAFLDAEWRRGPVFEAALREVTNSLSSLGRVAAAPAPVAPPPQVVGEWVARMYNHVGGGDLLRPPTTPDYFSKKEDIREEYRLHCFQGRSIRAGRKMPREGVTPHAWIRSYEGGWRIVYDGFESDRAMRELAAHACEALNLQFGAVDLGRKADGGLIVLEVNRAPGLEGGTVTSYARAIEGWLSDGGNNARPAR